MSKEPQINTDEHGLEAAKGQFLVYQAEDGTLKLDVRLEGETVWLTQPLMAKLFQTTQQNISQHVLNVYEEGELAPEATHKKFLSVRLEGKREAMRRIPMYMRDWIKKLDGFLTINDRDILNHAGKISHEMAKQLAESEYEKFHGKRLLDPEKLSDFDKAVKEIEASKKKGSKKHGQA